MLLLTLSLLNSVTNTQTGTAMAAPIDTDFAIFAADTPIFFMPPPRRLFYTPPCFALLPLLYAARTFIIHVDAPQQRALSIFSMREARYAMSARSAQRMLRLRCWMPRHVIACHAFFIL